MRFNITAAASSDIRKHSQELMNPNWLSLEQRAQSCSCVSVKMLACMHAARLTGGESGRHYHHSPLPTIRRHLTVWDNHCRVHGGHRISHAEANKSRACRRLTQWTSSLEDTIYTDAGLMEKENSRLDYMVQLKMRLNSGRQAPSCCLSIPKCTLFACHFIYTSLKLTGRNFCI